MTRKENYEVKTQKLLEPITESLNFEIVDIEFVKEAGNWFLRIYIDKPGGITIDDCEVVSRALSDELDKKDYIDEAYILEVSSPGLGRPLKKEKDFLRGIGEEVEVKMYKPIGKQKEFRGILKAYSKEQITLILEEETEIKINHKDIALIRLAFDF